MDTGHSRVRIVLADDRTILRTGLRHLLEGERDFQVVGDAEDGHEALNVTTKLQPDILVIDLQLPGLPVIEVLRQLSVQGDSVHSLVMATMDDEDNIAEAFRNGARGVVLEASATKDLIQGIRSVMDGKFWLGYRSVTRLGKRMPKLAELSKGQISQKSYGLTKREMQIVTAIVSGYSNKEMARKFSLSEDTIKHHLTNVFDKAGVYNRLELALFAIHHGLVGRR